MRGNGQEWEYAGNSDLVSRWSGLVAWCAWHHSIAELQGMPGETVSLRVTVEGEHRATSHMEGTTDTKKTQVSGQDSE